MSLKAPQLDQVDHGPFSTLHRLVPWHRGHAPSSLMFCISCVSAFVLQVPDGQAMVRWMIRTTWVWWCGVSSLKVHYVPPPELQTASTAHTHAHTHTSVLTHIPYSIKVCRCHLLLSLHQKNRKNEWKTFSHTAHDDDDNDPALVLRHLELNVLAEEPERVFFCSVIGEPLDCWGQQSCCLCTHCKGNEVKKDSKVTQTQSHKILLHFRGM